MIRAALISLVVMTATAQAADLRPAPAYYTETVFAVTMAEALAQGCGQVGINFGAIQERMTMLEAQLEEDGFSTETPFNQMIDPSATFGAMQRDFLARYPIEGAGSEAVCGAAASEISQETLIGSLLMEAPR
ncbi:DUF5333 family protein [Tropicimonas sp. S265A]|uniref:DUF5333 family protein n=1 Tax=Tropicimonas sp. S265A TaxID=3415134 RepID=UPI003C7B3279